MGEESGEVQNDGHNASGKGKGLTQASAQLRPLAHSSEAHKLIPSNYSAFICI